ncbi:hypothetical protein C3L33_05263, partial [Rhododendron williamsianum]
MAGVGVTMEVGNDGVAVITISNPPVNALAIPVIDGLKEKFVEATRREDVKAIVLTGDISILPDVSVDLVVNTIEDGKKPVVAAIEGLALGGGLELTMGCHARIAAPKAQLGLPELSLGVLPGFGGTQRLPRLLGLSKAVEMMLLSKPITSEEGKKLGLIDALVSSEELLRVPNVTDIGLKPRSVKRVAVIGGGLMGSGIATALILGNIYVVLKEVNSEYLLRGIKMVEGNVRGLVARKKLAHDKAEKALSMLKGVLDYSEFRNVDMVIEAVIEKVPLKQTIFSEIEKACPPHCILATNTSTIDLNVVGEKTSSQDRIVGAHFFSPAHVMPLLEIVRTEKTSAQVILDLMAVGKIIKKVPVVVGNCTAFAVNRTFFPYTQGSHLLLNLGVDVFRIDRLISRFGLPMGPFHFAVAMAIFDAILSYCKLLPRIMRLHNFTNNVKCMDQVIMLPGYALSSISELQKKRPNACQLQDLAGYGVALAVGKELKAAFSDRSFRSPLVELLVKSGRNGKNNGKGYYLYEKGSKPKPDPSVLPIIEECRRVTNVMPGGKPISVSDNEIVEMILFPVVNEACRVMDEGVVVRASDLDVASVLGMSFPSYRGGIVFWGDTVGPNYIYTSLKKWSELYGSFYKPSRFLEERATKGIPLSAPASTSPGSRTVTYELELAKRYSGQDDMILPQHQGQADNDLGYRDASGMAVACG